MVSSERAIVTKESLEVRFHASEGHEEAPEMDWTFKGWTDKFTMEIQLDFDQPEIVSMEIPLDYVTVTFYN